jgi:hypothetical protein
MAPTWQPWPAFVRVESLAGLFDGPIEVVLVEGSSTNLHQRRLL